MGARREAVQTCTSPDDKSNAGNLQVKEANNGFYTLD